MPLTRRKLGPYEILGPIGAGGMGEIYRARDSRIGREVALKLLPEAFAQDEERMRRFQQEARAAGMLNHPNILILYDVGTENSTPYLITELLQGETLRAKLQKDAVPQKKAIEYALQIAQGLAAAHDNGIVHRDLKPENIFITREGRVKILDFGLAKLTHHEESVSLLTQAATVSHPTEAGAVLGTILYMSPEQVRGEKVDHRSDLFAFGAVLYEMLTGKRPFSGGSHIEVMHAILKEDPPEQLLLNSKVQPGLERIIRRCLEKDPNHRFQSTSDLCFALEALSSLSSSLAGAAPVAPRKNLRRYVATAILFVFVAVSFFLGERLGSRKADPASSPVTIQQITFRRGNVEYARFAPDGQNIVYEASWNGQPSEIFVSRTDSPGYRSTDIKSAMLLSISNSGEMAIRQRGFILARVPLAGGAPRQMLENVVSAGWSPHGETLAVARFMAGSNILEYPIGKVLYKTHGVIASPRVSPKGDRIAFVEMPDFEKDFGGFVMLVDLDGQSKRLTQRFGGLMQVAWSPDAEEIWFSGSDGTSRANLYAVSMEGHLRLIRAASGALLDVFKDGRALVSIGYLRRNISGLFPGSKQERDLSWFSFSDLADLSNDGKTLLFTDTAMTGKGIYFRTTDGSPAVNIGDGTAAGLSNDGKWALAIQLSPARLVLVPTGPGQLIPLPQGSITEYHSAHFLSPQRIVFYATDRQGPRVFVQDIPAGMPNAITPEASFYLGPSPDKKFVLICDAQDQAYIYPIAGGTKKSIALNPEDEPIGWSQDNRGLYLRVGNMPARIYKFDIETARRELWKEITPPDSAGIKNIAKIRITPDGKSYAYSYTRWLNDLCLINGLK